MKPILWTAYLEYRCQTRNFRLEAIENIIHSPERLYYDVETARIVAVGKHDNKLVLIPYEETETGITPVTIHATSRRQINLRVRSGRFRSP